jgi:tetratricopeptide (TPR) repeat protein
VDKVKSIEDLAPAIELYYHTVGAGRYDEACDLLFSRLIPVPLHYRFGAYQLIIELARALFPSGENHSPRLKNHGAQAWTLNALANSYSHAGQPRRAVALFEQNNVLYEKAGDRRNLASGLASIALDHMRLGELAVARRDVLLSTRLSREIEDEFHEAIGHLELGRLLAYCGEFDEREAELRAAQVTFDNYGAGHTNYVSVVRSYRAERALLMGDPRAALQVAKDARTLADEVAKAFYPHERDFIRAESLLGAALVMEGKDLNVAATHLTEALTRCRRINLVETEPDILLAWARWHRARGNSQEAQAHAEEALAIADRCEYRLKQAEIHNFLARLALDRADEGRKIKDEGKDIPSSVVRPSSSACEALAEARKHAETARERAWCDGPPHCYKPALDEAEKMLATL